MEDGNNVSTVIQDLHQAGGYQIDETAINILIAYDYYKYTKDIVFLKRIFPMLQNAYKYIVRYIENVITFKKTKTFDLWENYVGESVFGISAVFASLKTMGMIYEAVKETYKENRLKVEQINKEIQKINPMLLDVKEWIHMNMYSNEKQAYVNDIENPKIDISTLSLVTPFNIFTVNEKKMINTYMGIEMNLRTYTGGYLRYENDNYLGRKKSMDIIKSLDG